MTPKPHGLRNAGELKFIKNWSYATGKLHIHAPSTATRVGQLFSGASQIFTDIELPTRFVARKSHTHSTEVTPNKNAGSQYGGSFYSLIIWGTLLKS